jgi:hypothetical protein
LAKFGGNEFKASLCLVFDGRYFVLEPGNPPMLTVFLERDGQPVFEVLRNRPKTLFPVLARTQQAL